MKKKATTLPTTIAIILGLLLLVTGYMWLTTEKKLEQTLEYGKDNVAFQHDKLLTECTAPDAESQNNCTRSLTELSDVISQVQKTRGSGTPATPAQ